jgi:hypothetical protein
MEGNQSCAPGINDKYAPVNGGLLQDGVATFTAGDLKKKYEDFQKFDKSGQKTDFVLFFELPSLDQLIVNQVALFHSCRVPPPNWTIGCAAKAQSRPKIYRRSAVRRKANTSNPEAASVDRSAGPEPAREIRAHPSGVHIF